MSNRDAFVMVSSDGRAVTATVSGSKLWFNVPLPYFWLTVNQIEELLEWAKQDENVPVADSLH